MLIIDIIKLMHILKNGTFNVICRYMNNDVDIWYDQLHKCIYVLRGNVIMCGMSMHQEFFVIVLGD